MDQGVETTADLLSSFRVIETFSEEQFRRFAAERLAARMASISASEGFSARTSIAFLRSFAICYGESSAAMSMDFTEQDLVRTYINDASGSGSVKIGGREHAVTDSASSIIPAGTPYQLETDGNHGFIILRIKPATLGKRLSAILDTVPRYALQFPGGLSNDDPRVIVLRRLVGVLSHQIGRVDPRSAFTGELEELVLSAFLRLSRFDPSSLHAPASPSRTAARIAAEYIEVHWQRAVSIEELVSITGVSGRSLFRGFRDVYGCTPRAFARRRRLWKAKEILENPSDSIHLAALATKCGFASLHHFRREYELLFGALPKRTD